MSIEPGFVDQLAQRGYCVIDVPVDDNAQRALEYFAEGQTYSCPRPSFAHAYLGGGDISNIGLLNIGNLLQEVPHETEEDDYWWQLANYCCDAMRLTCESLKNEAELSLGFRSADEPAEVMLRKYLPATAQAHADERTVVQHLDFCRQCRICLMSFVRVDGPSFIELTPNQQASGWKDRILHIWSGSLLVFRQDVFNYRYESGSPQDLVLHSWIREAIPDIQQPAMQGRALDVMSSLETQGCKFARMDEGNIEAVGGRLVPANGGDQMYAFYNSGCDAVQEIPVLRWDHSLYYSDDPSSGLALGKHLGLIDTSEMDSFDNEFWNITYDHTDKINREKLKSLEAGYEILHNAGFTRETMRNAPISLGIGGFQGYNFRSIGTPTGDVCLTQNFTSFYLGLTGRTFIVDTACSASMIAAHELFTDMLMHRDGNSLGVTSHGHTTMAMVLGVVSHYDPGMVIGNTQAHMMGTSGRTSSWDVSANGFGAGETMSGFYFRLGDNNPNDELAACSRLASIVGTSTNNDGRSASLTAPNGPAQTACYRQAMRNSRTSPGEVTMTECHCTGTKLGDAIEFGSSRTCFMANPDERYVPLPHGAFKSFTGHPFTGAGAAAIIKQIMTMRYCMTTPNLHLKSTNPNIDIAGYPFLMQSEVLDLGWSAMYIGCTGMGYGGSNSRVDMVGTCRQGFRRIPHMVAGPLGVLTCFAQAPDSQKHPEVYDVSNVVQACPKCHGDMCFRCCLAFGSSSDYHDHQCSLVREPLAAYDCCSVCYKGGYIEGVPPAAPFVNEGREIFIVGCQGKQSDMRLMDETIDDHGDLCYVQTITLDDTGLMEFRLTLDKDNAKTVYPIVNHAGPLTRIAGPDALHQNRSWLIDGSAGTTYRIKFIWNYERMEIDWSPSS